MSGSPSAAPGTATELTVAQPGGDHSPITTLRVSDAEGSFDVQLPPDADAAIDLPRPIDLAEVTFEIVAVDPRFVQNRRFNEPTQLPAAISEVLFDGSSPAVQPVCTAHRPTAHRTSSRSTAIPSG